MGTTMRSSLCLLVAFFALSHAAPIAMNVSMTPASGYELGAYESLLSSISSQVSAPGSKICITHGPDAAIALLPTKTCTHVVLLGAPPSSLLSLSLSQPLLVVGGSLDGVSRFTDFAVARHRFSAPTRRFAAIDGASHHSFASGPPSELSKAQDITASVAQPAVHTHTAGLIKDFVGAGPSPVLDAAEVRAAQLAAPLVAALKLEGSTALGHPSCNSDFPTNPTCKYPKFPDHSLPFGPAPAPSPPLPSDCVCGSPWVRDYANPMIAGFSESKEPSYTVLSNDAYQDVSDTHPFHLPHIFNSCTAGSATCQLNTTTLTMPISKAGDLFPNITSPPVSFFEFRTKMKSRQAVWEAAGLGDQDQKKTDNNMTMCKAINQRAYDWALANAETSVRARFEKDGEAFVMVDDKVATIGITGPEWIKDELVYTRAKTASGSQVEIQSWQFVVGNTNGGSVPWFFPVGMHYCKLLSPARAMEWIYTDGLRTRRGLKH